jgi:hypothetical protein
LAARHQPGDRTEQDGSGHGGEDATRVAAGDIAKAARHAAIEPVLDR